MKHAIAGVLFLFVSGCALLPYPFDQWEYPSPKLEALVERSQPTARLSPADLQKRGEQYKGKVVEITGTIAHISNKGGQAALSLHGDIICGFGQKQKSMIATLNKGQTVTLRGIVSETSNTFLTPCILIR